MADSDGFIGSGAESERKANGTGMVSSLSATCGGARRRYRLRMRFERVSEIEVIRFVAVE